MNIGMKRYAAGLTIAALGALAGMSAQAASGDATYQEEIARCNSGQSGQDRATCLREAGAARQEGRRGNLSSAQDSAYESNRTARCEGLPAADRADCLARLERGTESGSVKGGGILRERREVITPRPSSPAMPSGAGPAMP
ncbi:hypothetical protein PIGHUM_01734 [Pigmentiphaga humi]|uniref:Cysteine rich repeat protein n=1 Tax=Pigmentiphaga humi TaxID=2478468 RepID=A0A3P4B1C7_9BURK|nr:hypothetical protein [Pigmentiphaga humi]VCU69671.1 hypothetical protein PIGHUM_01734 [Pigmentiphaga humi]